MIVELLRFKHRLTGCSGCDHRSPDRRAVLNPDVRVASPGSSPRDQIGDPTIKSDPPLFRR